MPFKFGIDGDGNYGYYGADDSLIPFSKSISGIVSKPLSTKYTATKDGIYSAFANIVYPQNYGLPSWSTTGTIIKQTSGTAENHYGVIACIVNLKKGDTIAAINPYPNSTYGGCIIFCP